MTVAVMAPVSMVNPFGVDGVLVGIGLLALLIAFQMPDRVPRGRMLAAVVVLLIFGACQMLQAYVGLHPCHGVDPDSWSWIFMGCWMI